MIAVSNPDAVLAATSHSVRLADDSLRGGQLFRFSLDGRRQQTFSFEETLVFPTTGYSPPWQVTDFRVQPHGGTWRIAISAHHHEWWPGLVTVLDSNWQRHGTFVHAAMVLRGAPRRPAVRSAQFRCSGLGISAYASRQ